MGGEDRVFAVKSLAGKMVSKMACRVLSDMLRPATTTTAATRDVGRVHAVGS